MVMNDFILSRNKIISFVRDIYPDVKGAVEMQRLSGGNLNIVWRIRTEENTFIIKHAPPYIATQPEIPLDESRIKFESRILYALNREQKFRKIQAPAISYPKWMAFNESGNLLMIEDLGDCNSILIDLPANPHKTERYAKGLGRFIARLHVNTFKDQELKKKFNNRPVQKTRHEVQYKQCGTFLENAGVATGIAKRAGERCRQLGTLLVSPGFCLVMGDLWPQSILVRNNGLALIDWEMTHYGRPLQDVAHLDAHLWMMEHRSDDPEKKTAIQLFRNTFLTTYYTHIKQNGALYNRLYKEHYGIHFGAEILARTVGAFQNGYLYHGMKPNDPLIKEAVNNALESILG